MNKEYKPGLQVPKSKEPTFRKEKIGEAELVRANIELAFQNEEKEKRAAELITFPIDDTGKRKKEEERIGHLAAIVESSEDAIISKSLTGIIRSWNNGGEKMFGFTANQAIGKHISLIIPPEYIDEEKDIIRRIRNNETIDHYETVRIKKNGELVYVSLTVSPLKDHAGVIIGVSKIARDITSRKNSETELILANKKLGFQNEEKEKRTAELIIANKKLAFQNEEKGKRAAELVIANKELIFQTEEKAKRAAELLIANKELAFQNQEKEKRAAELIIANQKLSIQSESRLKEASDYKHALDESSNVAITDQKGIITYVNDNFCKISKYAAEELIGQDHRIVNSGHHSKEFIQKLWVTITNGKIWKGELKNKAKDGTLYWLDTTIIPFLDEQGKPYQYVAIRADITLRKQAEEKLQVLHDELENRVKERTEDLESFSYSVSHDLRAPLRAMSGYARMLKSKYESHSDQEANRLVNNIVNNAAKMGQLIDDLLTFSRLGRRELIRMNIPMQEIVINICGELKKEQGHRDIEFDIRELRPVKADNIGIKQVWLNLISNAIKYSRLKKKAIIEIGSEIKGDEIIYYVKDNGAGFDMRYASKLFNIFQRLHSEEE